MIRPLFPFRRRGPLGGRLAFHARRASLGDFSSMDTPGQPTSRCARFVDGRLRSALMVAAVMAAAATSAGCRSGASATSAPSWWSFGGKGGDAEKLSAAPPFEGSIKKPSEAAMPYPTTTTPNGYAVADAAGAPALAGTAAPALPPAEPAAITYGSQPSPSATVASAPTAVTAPPAITPQVGPYAPLAGAAPQTAVPASAAIASAPAAAPAAQPWAAPPASSGSFPATAGYEPTAAASPPDPSGLAAPSAASPASPAPVEPASPASRYASVPGSRFGGTSFSSPPASAPLEPAAPLSPPASPSPPPPPMATSLPAAPPLPAASPLASPPVLPGAPPLPSPQASPPPRRPDPGYRPGGTTSYRPTRAILVESAPAAASAVRTAAFETPAPAAP
jgi:hypothetical protein